MTCDPTLWLWEATFQTLSDKPLRDGSRTRTITTRHATDASLQIEVLAALDHPGRQDIAVRYVGPLPEPDHAPRLIRECTYPPPKDLTP